MGWYRRGRKRERGTNRQHKELRFVSRCGETTNLSPRRPMRLMLTFWSCLTCQTSQRPSEDTIAPSELKQDPLPTHPVPRPPVTVTVPDDLGPLRELPEVVASATDGETDDTARRQRRGDEAMAAMVLL